MRIGNHRLFLIQSILLCLCCMAASAQETGHLFHDFPYGWGGDTAHFTHFENGKLKLEAPAAGASKIYKHFSFSDSMTWSVDVQMDLSPSSNNTLKVFLASMDSLFSERLYYLKIGESGTGDAIELYFSDTDTLVLMGRGRDGLVSRPFKLRIQLEKTGRDDWILYAYEPGAAREEAQFEINFPDSLLYKMAYCGLEARYTISNRNAFAFENFTLETYRPDTSGPRLIAFDVISGHELALQFDELVYLDKEDVRLQDSQDVSLTVSLMINQSGKLSLLFDQALDPCETYQLTISPVRDAKGNRTSLDLDSIRFIDKARPGEILINEILFDPDASGSDFIELINPGNLALDLEGLAVINAQNGQKSILDKGSRINPSSLLVLTENPEYLRARYQLSADIPVLEVNLPALNNSGGYLSLAYQVGPDSLLSIDAFEYSPSFHLPELPDTEGISLERRKALSGINARDNWTSSADLVYGASPGRINTVALNDHVNVHLVSPDTIELHFNTRLAENAIHLRNALLASGFEFSALISKEEAGNRFCVALAEEITGAKVYELNLSGIYDLCGQALPDTTVRFFQLEHPREGDLFINEVLFDPYPLADDFIEIINVSEQFISLDSLEICNLDNQVCKAIRNAYILSPGEIIAFTESPGQTMSLYTPPMTARIVAQDLPAFNNNSGNVSLFLNSGSRLHIDSFDYSEDMHFDLIADTEGVSLERLSTQLDSNDPDNWHSAAEATHWASPGYANANDISLQYSSEQVYLEKQIFSPDADGMDDYLVLHYQLDKPYYIANIVIRDDRGNIHSNLTHNRLLGSEGIIRWDGLDTAGRLSPLGIYLLYYELFHEDGSIIHGKKPFVLAYRLD